MLGIKDSWILVLGLLTMTDRLISIKEASEILGIHTNTLRYWDNEGKLTATKTRGGHRKYRLYHIMEVAGMAVPSKSNSETVEKVATYCRVSSHDQKVKGDLDRQKARVLQYCIDKSYNVVICFDEVGSGMNDQRAKLRKLMTMAVNKDITKVVVEHTDRLTRFNYHFIETFFESHGVKVEFIEQVLNAGFENELVSDMLALMASFSAKIYGKRSATNRKKNAELKKGVVQS